MSDLSRAVADSILDRAPLDSRRPSRTEISMRVKGILADSTGCLLSGITDAAPLVRLGTLRSVINAIENIEASFSVSLEERFSDPTFLVRSVGEIISLVEGAINEPY